MTLFEFISVMVSIVLGLSLAQTLSAGATLAGEEREVRPFLPHTLWVVTLLLLHFLTWWSVWDYRELDWNYARFLVVISSPLLLFFVSALVFPRKMGGEVIDLEQHFGRIRSLLMMGYTALTVIYILDGPLAFGEPLLSIYRVPQTMALAAVLAGIRTPNHRAQLAVAWVVLLVVASGSVFRFVPGAFSPN